MPSIDTSTAQDSLLTPPVLSGDERKSIKVSQFNTVKNPIIDTLQNHKLVIFHDKLPIFKTTNPEGKEFSVCFTVTPVLSFFEFSAIYFAYEGKEDFNGKTLLCNPPLVVCV